MLFYKRTNRICIMRYICENRIFKSVFLSVVVQLLSCVWLFATPMDWSSPGSSVHGISQARIPKWVATSFSRGSSQPWDRTCISCIAGRFFTTESPGNINLWKKLKKYSGKFSEKILEPQILGFLRFSEAIKN